MESPSFSRPKPRRATHIAAFRRGGSDVKGSQTGARQITTERGISALGPVHQVRFVDGDLPAGGLALSVELHEPPAGLARRALFTTFTIDCVEDRGCGPKRDEPSERPEVRVAAGG